MHATDCAIHVQQASCYACELKLTIIESQIHAQDDLLRLQESVHAPSPVLQRACLFPRYEQLALFMSQQPLLSFAAALDELSQTARMRKHYFFGDVDVLCELARLMEHLPLSLAERWAAFT